MPLANLRKESVLKLKKQNKRVLKRNNKKVENVKLILVFIFIIIIFYVLYAIVNLVIKPVDVVLVEEGKIYLEEKTVGYVLREEEIISRTKL